MVDAELTPPPGRGVRRTAWTVVDQAVSGTSNVVATLVVARSVPSEGFGAFSVAFIAYVLALGVERGLVGRRSPVERCC